jgi:hypothetical protein
MTEDQKRIQTLEQENEKFRRALKRIGKYRRLTLPAYRLCKEIAREALQPQQIQQ